MILKRGGYPLIQNIENVKEKGVFLGSHQGKTIMAPVKNKLPNMKIVQTQMAALWILKV